MCGIFGIVSQKNVSEKSFKHLAKLAQQRGKDSSGLVKYFDDNYCIYRSDSSILNLIKKVKISNSSLLLGHSRLVTMVILTINRLLRTKLFFFIME